MLQMFLRLLVSQVLGVRYQTLYNAEGVTGSTRFEYLSKAIFLLILATASCALFATIISQLFDGWAPRIILPAFWFIVVIVANRWFSSAYDKKNVYGKIFATVAILVWTCIEALGNGGGILVNLYEADIHAELTKGQVSSAAINAKQADVAAADKRVAAIPNEWRDRINAAEGEISRINSRLNATGKAALSTAQRQAANTALARAKASRDNLARQRDAALTTAQATLAKLQNELRVMHVDEGKTITIGQKGYAFYVVAISNWPISVAVLVLMWIFALLFAFTVVSYGRNEYQEKL